MDEIWTRIVENLHGRVGGLMTFRLILQPLMASFFAIRSGLRDARTGESPYFWALVTEPADRMELLRDGWKSVGKVFVLALLLDIAYQVIVLHFVYPGEALIVAFLLAIVPYLLLRGLVTRIASRIGS